MHAKAAGVHSVFNLAAVGGRKVSLVETVRDSHPLTAVACPTSLEQRGS